MTFLALNKAIIYLDIYTWWSWGTKVDLKKHLEIMLQELPVKTEEIKGVMKKEIEKLKEAFEFYKTPVPEELMI